MVTVRVPATIANLGPAFDALGVAVTVYNTVHLTLAASARVQVQGYGQGSVPEDSANLVYRAAAEVAVRAGRSSAFALRCHNDIPPGRGLGSSAAAVVGGAVAANEVLGRPLNREDLLDLAWPMGAVAPCGGRASCRRGVSRWSSPCRSSPSRPTARGRCCPIACP